MPGSQVRIICNCYFYNGKIVYFCSVAYKAKGKRKWLHVEASGHGQLNTIYAPYSDYVSAEEILAAKLECWHKMNPNLIEE